MYISIYIYIYTYIYIYSYITRINTDTEGAYITKTLKQSHNTGARANNTLRVTRTPHRGACYAECVRSAPLGRPRTASRVCGSGRRRLAETRLLLARDNHKHTSTHAHGTDPRVALGAQIIYVGI